jgi:hypothetical protein
MPLPARGTIIFPPPEQIDRSLHSRNEKLFSTVSGK